jgi:hypothetical protein
MHALPRLIAVALCAAAAASAVQAQRLSSATRPTPSAAAQAAQAAPAPGGLRPVFPAGVSSGSGSAVSRDPIAATTSPIPAGTPAPVIPGITPGTIVGGGGGGGTVTPDPGPVVATNVMGAGATVRGPGQRLEGGAGGFSATDIARSFFFADGNKDGDLTRAEAARLSILTMPFEEMDRNFDGLISRFEYDDSVR